MKEFFKTPEQRNQERIQQKQQEQRLRQFDKAGGLLNPHYDTEGNLIGGTDPVTGKHVNLGEGAGMLDQTYTTSPDAYDVAPQRGKAYESQLDQELPDISPTHMTPFGGSEEFNKFFHPDTVQPAGEQPAEEGGGSAEVVASIDKLSQKMDDYWG
jgi:hypothetical protein